MEAQLPVAMLNVSLLNGSLLTPPPPQLKHSLSLTIIICVAYLAVFLIGVLGNICVVLVVWRFPRMRSATNLFIANLAVADLLVNVVCLPFTLLSNVIDAWVLGDAICKAVPYLQGVSVSASIHTLVCISVERCLAICCPLGLQLSQRTSRRLIAAVWVLSLVITLPWVIVFDLEPIAEGGAMICYEAWPTPFSQTLYFAVAHLSLCYLLPLTSITVCYLLIWRCVCRRQLPGEGQISGGPAEQMLHRSKIKVLKMLLVVVVSFALSWMPLYALMSRLRFVPALGDEEMDVIAALLPFAQWLGTSNSCTNPIVYAYFNRRFRNCFTVILARLPCCGRSGTDYDNHYNYTRRSNPPASRACVRLDPVSTNSLRMAQEGKAELDSVPASPQQIPHLSPVPSPAPSPVPAPVPAPSPARSPAPGPAPSPGPELSPVLRRCSSSSACDSGPRASLSLSRSRSASSSPSTSPDGFPRNAWLGAELRRRDPHPCADPRYGVKKLLDSHANALVYPPISTSTNETVI